MNTILQLFDWGYLPIFYPGNLKNPVTTDWGHRRYTRDELIRVLPSIPNESAVGLILGREGRLIDIEIDDRELAGPELAEIFPNGLPDAPGHDSKRGGHYFFAWDDRLDAIGKQKVYWNSETNAVEIRLGCRDKQTQSRIPPSKGMEWRKPLSADPMPLPEDVIERMIAMFSRPEVIQAQSLRLDSRDSDETLTDDPRLRAKAISALSFLKCYDSYEDWRAIGMALHSIGPDLFEEWDRWSRQSEKFREGETVKQWNNFGPGAITAGTLFYMAKEAGWMWPNTDAQFEVDSESNSIGQMEDNGEMSVAEPTWAKVFPITYFGDEPEPRCYLIDGILVEGEPCIIGGPKKTLKTSIAMDMALSLRSAHPFLGKFRISQPDQEFGALPEILFMSAESGVQTLCDLRLRICQSKGLDPRHEETQIAFCPKVPKFSNRKMMEIFRRVLDDLKPSILFVDPAYIAMPAGVSSSLTDMGEALYEMIDTTSERNITFILLAHHRKNRRKGPPTLDDISGVGYAEAFRQWVLLNRMGKYGNDGTHELYMMAGGSAGHDGLYSLRIDEGKMPKSFDDPPRHWEILHVGLSSEDSESRARRDFIDKGEDLLVVLRTHGQATKSTIGTAVSLRGDRLDEHLERLITQGRIETFDFKAPRATKTAKYYRLTQAERDTYDQAS